MAYQSYNRKLRRVTAKRDVLYWNDGLPIYFDSFYEKYRYLGRMVSSDKAREWCKEKGVEFCWTAP